MTAEMVRRCTLITLFAPQQRPQLGIPPRLRQNPRPTHQRRVMPYMLVMPTRQFGHPMVFFVLEVAGDGLLHGLGGF